MGMPCSFNGSLYVLQAPIHPGKLYNSLAHENCHVTDRICKINTLQTTKFLQFNLILYMQGFASQK